MYLQYYCMYLQNYCMVVNVGNIKLHAFICEINFNFNTY